ncbi:TBC1 domain family, member 19 [Trypanosoma conorhini]|uniref:TBC1 domain family, member 19 n=1 Tax=Trypanosoma conorhini TaxID=83891 RepID=A0A422NU70_9TRYP|nr:TBC1 domain family, member 19 [Trypanosoma conorhini]RNF08998.1 TBC1 domain family, member 19 [Trypanosoma conorhini]
MSWARPYGGRATPVPEVRLPQRGKPREVPSATLRATLPRWLDSAGAEKQGGTPTQRPAPETNSNSHFPQQEVNATVTSLKLDGVLIANGTSTSVSKGNAWGEEQMPPCCPEPMQDSLSVVVSKQNSDWDSRRHGLLERRERELSHQSPNGGDGPARQASELSRPLCMLLHTLLAESRKQWRAVLSTRVNALKREVRRSVSGALPDRNAGDENEEVEWSVAQLYNVLVTGLNSAATEEFLTARVFGGDPSLCYDSIDSFGLLTVFRAPVQEILAQHEQLAPSLTVLRRYFAALHPSNGCPKFFTHTESSASDALEKLDIFLQHGNTPEAVAKALRGRVSHSLRRLLYARALQLPIVVTDGNSLFGGRGELQANRHCDGVERCLTFATKHSRDKIRRRMCHSYATREQEETAKVIQAIIKVDNAQFVGNSDKYFIFAEETEMLVFSLLMDRGLPEMHMKHTVRQLGRPSAQLDSYLVFLENAGGGPEPRQRKAPPSGFFPLRSCSLLVAPVCYITGDTVEQYDLLSSLFGQLWFRLQGPTPELAQCCWIFEALVARFAAPACLHATRALGLPPLRLALQWMLTAFVEVLEPAELLSFWDLILSYHVEEMFAERTPLSVSIHASEEHGMEDETKEEEAAAEDGEEEKEEASSSAPCALWLLPLLAASLFVYRAPLVERCATAEEMLLVFREGHHVRCRPLLQYLLFMAK